MKKNNSESEIILVLAPTARDASLSQSILREVGISSESVGTISDLCARLDQGAAAIILPEEALETEDVNLLSQRLGNQPGWSDIPILVLTRGGANSLNASRAFAYLGNAILLERPVRINTLVSAARVALRSRRRQYEIRRHLLEYQRAEADLKRSEQQLKDESAKLFRSNLELEQFAYVSSHDLKEPLRKISNFAQLLSAKYGDGLDETGRRYLESITDGAMRMRNLISDLLSFARISQEDALREEVDLGVVFDRVLTDLELTITEKQAVITADPMPTVIGNESQLQHVFLNLLSNALKFHGDRPPKIHCGSSIEGTFARISVRDNGIGFEPHYAEQVFEIFRQLHPKSRFGGTGVGLAICKKIIEQNGGRIWAESRPGEGATFYMTIPLARSSLQRSPEMVSAHDASH